ncbi:hypothetical protein [Streptomyces hainanensis]|uniref:Secreted protein n=1 Tax=Streptomyces hainanensis TaxID=402648 RepID=A0A4R4TCT6_9ACTN|nr:hypothetical protein [Streptomyces hainanensis]TDC75110.1 hypothetical protein E1283_13505 [Streptomyces hainanensis]
MDLRDNKSRLILIVVALGAALVIAVASCGGGGDDGNEDDGAAGSSQETTEGGGDSGDDEPTDDAESGEGESEVVLAEVTGEQEITMTVTSAERQSGGFLTIEGTIYNGGGEAWGTAAWAGDESELAGNDFSMAGATLTAREEGKRYLILRDTAGRCLCTGFGLQIEAGDTMSWYAQFPEPDPATTEVDFQIGQMPPATIEIR